MNVNEQRGLFTATEVEAVRRDSWASRAFAKNGCTRRTTGHCIYKRISRSRNAS